MPPISATLAGPSFNQGEGASLIPRLSAEELTNWFSSFMHLILSTHVCTPTMVPTEAGHPMGPELAHASDYQSHPEGITTSAMGITPFSGRAVPTMAIVTLMPLHFGVGQYIPSLDQGTELNPYPPSHLTQPFQPAMGHSMAPGGTTIDPHLECGPPLGSIPIDTRNSTPQPREFYHYQPSGYGDTTQELIADGSLTTVAASPGVAVYSPLSNQVPETYSRYHPSPFSPVNSGVVLPAPPAYQDEGHWPSASQRLQDNPPLSTTAGPIRVDQYASCSDYQPSRLDDTTREPIPNGTTTAVTNSPGVTVYPPPFNPTPATPGVYSWHSASGHQFSPSPVNSAVVPPVPLPKRRKWATTSQQFLGQTYQDAPTFSTTAGPSQGMAVDQQPSHYDYPSGHGDTTHELIQDSPPTAITASPGGIVYLPFHFVSGPPNHPPVGRGVIPPTSVTYENEGNGQSTSRKLCQTYQGAPTSFTTPGPIPGVSADQHPSRYQCTKCGANFARRAALNRHHKDKHRPWLVCPGCSSEFSSGRMYRFTEHRQTCSGH